MQGAVSGLAGGFVSVPVKVTNLSRVALSRGRAPFGLSYHLLSEGGALLEFDHPRQWFTEPLAPERARIIDVPIEVPEAAGRYELEFDIVWEGVLWLKDRGNPVGRVALTAVADAADPVAPELRVRNVTGPRSRLTVLCSGMMAGDPHYGGATWAVLQYVLGLRQLGHHAFFVEPIAADKIRPGGAALADSSAAAYLSTHRARARPRRRSGAARRRHARDGRAVVRRSARDREPHRSA